MPVYIQLLTLTTEGGAKALEDPEPYLRSRTTSPSVELRSWRLRRFGSIRFREYRGKPRITMLSPVFLSN